MFPREQHSQCPSGHGFVQPWATSLRKSLLRVLPRRRHSLGRQLQTLVSSLHHCPRDLPSSPEGAGVCLSPVPLGPWGAHPSGCSPCPGSCTPAGSAALTAHNPYIPGKVTSLEGKVNRRTGQDQQRHLPGPAASRCSLPAPPSQVPQCLSSGDVLPIPWAARETGGSGRWRTLATAATREAGNPVPGSDALCLQ